MSINLYINGLSLATAAKFVACHPEDIKTFQSLWAVRGQFQTQWTPEASAALLALEQVWSACPGADRLRYLKTMGMLPFKPQAYGFESVGEVKGDAALALLLQVGKALTKELADYQAQLASNSETHTMNRLESVIDCLTYRLRLVRTAYAYIRHNPKKYSLTWS
jgi:hypothetical protein